MRRLKETKEIRPSIIKPSEKLEYIRPHDNKKLISKMGTPPGSMNPIKESEWWDICRDETEPGIEHPEIYPGCYECYTMCASHPKVEEPDEILECANRAIRLCVLREIEDSWQKLLDYINPPDTCDWKKKDKDTWEADECRDPIACSNECVRFCDTKGFSTGQCETSGDKYYCNCD